MTNYSRMRAKTTKPIEVKGYKCKCCQTYAAKKVNSLCGHCLKVIDRHFEKFYDKNYIKNTNQYKGI